MIKNIDIIIEDLKPSLLNEVKMRKSHEDTDRYIRYQFELFAMKYNGQHRIFNFETCEREGMLVYKDNLTQGIWEIFCIAFLKGKNHGMKYVNIKRMRQ